MGSKSVHAVAIVVGRGAGVVGLRAILVGVALLLMAAEKLGGDVNAVRLTLKPLGEYFQLFRDEVRVIAFPIAGWFVLWFFTGSPRILPWKQVTNDD